MKLLMNTTSPYARIVRIGLLEKDVEAEMQLVNPWGDTPELLAANSAGRVPTLITDDGLALTESLLILHWLESTRPSPSLLGTDPTAELARAGVAMGVIDAAVHIMIGRVISGVSFDAAPVGLRRRRSIVDGLKRLDAALAGPDADAPAVSAITAITALDYVRFRFVDVDWLPAFPNLNRLREHFSQRPAFVLTAPHA